MSGVAVVSIPAPVCAPKPPPLAGLSGWAGRIHAGDCLKVMAKMPPESIGAVITSPPYNIKNSTGNGLKCGKGKRILATMYNNQLRR